MVCGWGQFGQSDVVWLIGIWRALVDAMVCPTQGVANVGWIDWLDHVGAGNLAGTTCVSSLTKD